MYEHFSDNGYIGRESGNIFQGYVKFVGLSGEVLIVLGQSKKYATKGQTFCQLLATRRRVAEPSKSPALASQTSPHCRQLQTG